MKESIGGTWLFGIVVTFVVLFTSFISLSTNYSRCFRIKDEMIATIEHYNGINEKSISRINTYLNGIGYGTTGNCPDGNSPGEDGFATDGTWYGFVKNNNSNFIASKENVNYCIQKVTIVEPYCVNDTSKEVSINGPIGHPRSAYYQVLVFFALDMPILRSLFNVNISGETSVVYNWNDDMLQEKWCD